MSESIEGSKPDEPADSAYSTAGETITVAIVIPTKNRHDLLLETVDKIADQRRLPDELLIIDQSELSCESRLQDVLKRRPDLNLRYIWDPQIPGLVAARIKGIEESSSEIIFYVDDDTSLDPDCIANLADRYMEHPEYAGISGVDVGGASVPWWLVIARRAYMLGQLSDPRSLTNKRYMSMSQPRPTRLVSGGWVSYRRRIFSEFQFEDKLWGHRWNSSIDFSYRVSAKYPIVIDPLVRVLHRDPYGTHSPDEFVRIRVAGAFFFFQRNIKKSIFGWACFLWLLTAIFVRSIWRGFQKQALRRTVATFFAELRKGISFIKKPFEASY